MSSTHATAFAPGRVNLIGEHTDYNGGLALPFATEAGVTVHACVLDGENRVQSHALDLREHDEFDLRAPPQADGWRAYVRGAVAELQRAGLSVCGARLEISGDVPRGSGLSSSAALEVATCLALIELAGEPVPAAVELAGICSRIEHHWAGSQSGLLDQLASLCGRVGSAVRIDFQSLAMRQVPLSLGEHRLVTVDSGESHTNAASGYNERRAECVRACELLGVESLREASAAAAGTLPSPLRERVEHVLSENERVDQAVIALERRDWPALGALLDASHASLRDRYEVSIPAVDATVTRLKQAGALGARIVGGGFGGHVLALLRPGAEAPEDALEVRPGAGARLL